MQYCFIYDFGSTTPYLSNLTDQLQKELLGRTSYVLDFGPTAIFLWGSCAVLPIFAFIFCIPTRIAMEWTLMKYITNISNGSKKLHKAFLNVSYDCRTNIFQLLTAEALLTVGYFLCETDFFFLKYPILTEFSYMIFKTPSIFQAIFTLYFIPNLRRACIKPFLRKETSTTVIVSMM